MRFESLEERRVFAAVSDGFVPQASLGYVLVDSISVDDRGNTSSGSVVLESQTDYLFVASGTTTIDTKGRIGNSYNWQLDQRGRPYTTSPRSSYGLAMSLDGTAPAKPNWMADVALLSVLNEPTRVPGVQTSTFVIQRTGMGQPARIRFLDTPYDDNGGRSFQVEVYERVFMEMPRIKSLLFGDLGIVADPSSLSGVLPSPSHQLPRYGKGFHWLDNNLDGQVEPADDDLQIPAA